MKSLFRNYLINTGSLWVVAQMVPALVIQNGLIGLAEAGLVFMVANLLLVPLIKILLLPINLLTFGLFAWLANVIVLFLITKLIDSIRLLPYQFPGSSLGGFIIPAMNLTTLQSAIVVSLLLAIMIHFLHWLLIK